MKILVVSDSHDNWHNLEKAISIGNELGCEVMLHAGDFVVSAGIDLLDTFNGAIHIVWGNNEVEKDVWRMKINKRENTTHHEDTMQTEIDGLKFYMNHYPEIVRDMAENHKYDVCIYGHDHFYNDEVLDSGARLLNPGEVVGWKTGTATCMIFDTTNKKAEKVIIAENQDI